MAYRQAFELGALVEFADRITRTDDGEEWREP
jgi:hypothetical protein